jgi:hypothetical protein
VRRFVRPVLMRDPQVEIEEKARQASKKDDEKGKEEKEEHVSQHRETKAPRQTETPPKRGGRER